MFFSKGKWAVRGACLCSHLQFRSHAATKPPIFSRYTNLFLSGVKICNFRPVPPAFFFFFLCVVSVSSPGLTFSPLFLPNHWEYSAARVSTE